MRIEVTPASPINFTDAKYENGVFSGNVKFFKRCRESSALILKVIMDDGTVTSTMLIRVSGYTGKPIMSDTSQPVESKLESERKTTKEK